MRLNSMLATVLIFLCSLVISSCSNDELAPISLKNRETANIKLNYPNNQTYSFPLQGGDGNYEISCDKPEIIETKMISSCDISIKARSEEHTSELQSRFDLVCRLLLEKKTQTI